ncbi:hypothetical protein H5410_063056 [Solanum commersonii]|uniref:Uncharacterized protein n=1 Tax=Solanum commersonii TaxID=4109 RepID=A0A9J5WCH2_SOLCO|nr:hypothetical protein H5410_063056 [Solanum commersonii]
MVRSSLLYDVGVLVSWELICSEDQKKHVAEMHENVEMGRGSLCVADKMREVRLIWFGHVKRWCANAPTRNCERLGVGNT